MTLCMILRIALISVASWSVGCGATVVFETDGSGGSGQGGSSSSGSPSSTKATSSGGVTTGGMCADLLAAFELAVVEATACNPFISVPQCTGTAILLDTCGCPAIVANELQPGLVDAARTAYDAWVAAGCGPYDCQTCDRARSGACVPAPDGQSGVCTPVTDL
jgi:hypothetical protein